MNQETILQENQELKKEMENPELCPDPPLEGGENNNSHKPVSFVMSTTTRSQRLMRGTKTTNQEKGFYGTLEIEAKDFSLQLENHMRVLPTAVKITFDIFLMKYYEQGGKGNVLCLPLRDYMNVRGIKDPKTARQQVIEHINALQYVKFSCSEKSKEQNKKTLFQNLSLCADIEPLKNGIIKYFFPKEYLKYRQETQFFISYPQEIYQINVKQFPYAYFFGCQLAENFRMNEGKPRQDTVSVQALLRNTPTLPTVEEIAQGKRQYYSRIIVPVIKNLDQLHSVQYKFYPKDHYDDSDCIHDPLTAFKGKDGNKAFFRSVLKIDYSQYPSNLKRLEKMKESTKFRNSH